MQAFKYSKLILRAVLLITVATGSSACSLMNIDFYHPLLRSDHILEMEDEQRILAGGRVETTEDGRIQVLYVSGTPYERGYQHGALLRAEVRDNFEYLYRQAIKTFRHEMIFEEAFERLRPFIPEEYMEEMHGLAHGSRLPLKVIHHLHALPSLSEWGGKKRIREIAKQMIMGDLGTSCSNIGLQPASTEDGKMYAVRILDWGLHRISKLHEYPLLIVDIPEEGYASVNLTWAGFIGAVSGLNEQGITLGEMGHGDPPNETLRGKPMVFLLREILQRASSLEDVRELISGSPGTNSFGYLMTDGKTGEAELYVRDPDRFLVFQPGERIAELGREIAGVDDICYGGHDNPKLTKLLSLHRGNITPELLKQELIPEFAMHSNFQNVIYSPEDLQFWVSYASAPGRRASEEPYTFFDFGEALKRARGR